MTKTKTTTDASAPKRRRADAERSIASITNAALEALASDPDVSMAEIARRAGVVRATIYMHFPTRESLLDAVMEHATGQVADAIREAEPGRGEPKEALERVLLATWRHLSLFHGILAINMNRLSAKELRRRHLPMTTQIVPLLERGQAAGAFRSDVSAEWLIAAVRAIVHVASTELQAGRLTETDVERTMLTTALAAVSPPLAAAETGKGSARRTPRPLT
jgi:AcrR family transcriptional regulator